jgi:hypothetical protein
MPVDQNYWPHIGCIFVHIPKTGGTSVTALLAEIDAAMRNRGAEPKFAIPSDPLSHKHMKGAELRALDPEAWERAFTFCAVRNPFEQIVSSYEWWRQRASDFPFLRKIAEIMFRSVRDFEGFVKHPLGSGFLNEAEGNPEDWFLDKDGKEIVDFILRAERIEELFDRLAERGIAVPRGLVVPRLNTSEHAHYSSYYTAAARELVTARFRTTIDRFGYEFETK